MKGIFYAFGPTFPRNYTLDNSSVLHNIDLFNLMCVILNIDQCPPSNGTLEHIKPLFAPGGATLDIMIFVIRKFDQKQTFLSIDEIVFFSNHCFGYSCCYCSKLVDLYDKK